MSDGAYKPKDQSPLSLLPLNLGISRKPQQCDEHAFSKHGDVTTKSENLEGLGAAKQAVSPALPKLYLHPLLQAPLASQKNFSHRLLLLCAPPHLTLWTPTFFRVQPGSCLPTLLTHTHTCLREMCGQSSQRELQC